MSNPGEFKTCLSCPSYLKAEDSPKYFKKSIGAPVCLRYGIPLGRPGSTPGQEEKLAKFYANKCDAYGKPAPGAPLEYRFQVAMPDPEMLHASDPDSAEFKMCTTCGTCSKFVPDRHVARELGWTTGLCSAKGKLILPTRQTYEARDCNLRHFGNVRQSCGSTQLLPEYEDAFNLSANPVAAYFKKEKGEFVEPHEYETDKEVSDEDRSFGIRAWRKFVDPEGSGNEAFLPVYDPEHFDEEERAKIPRTGDDEHPELYIDHFGGGYLAAVTWTELDETPALWGEAGTGKTELFRHLAWLMCLPFERVSITASTELDDLFGKMHYSPDKGTYFTYGRLPKAWSKPCVLVIDEPNVGRPDVWQAIRPLTDNSKQMVLDMNENEARPRHQDCYLGFAMNPAWDVRNVGTNQIGDADANRLFHIFIELPPPELEREIIRKRVALDGWEIDDKRMESLMGAAVEIRGLSKEGTLPITWGIRPQIKVARAMRWFDPVTAYRRAIADYLEPEPQQALLDVVRAHLR